MTICDQVRSIETQMRQDCPEMVAEAERIADVIIDPATADAEACWSILWDKPLYAYTRVEIADGYRQHLLPFVAGREWQQWSDPERPWLVLNGPANRDASFRFTPWAPDDLKGLRIARGRLFAVQGAARALKRWADQSETPLAAMMDRDPEELLQDLRSALGPHWGHITIMHFLTDAGLFCKPDRWLVRTVRHLGLCETVRADRGVPTRAEAILIDRAVKQIVRDLDGSLTPRRLRYIDKILMEAGKQGVIDCLPTPSRDTEPAPKDRP